MQKRYRGPVLLALFFLLPALTGFFGSAPKLAVVDMQRLMRDSEPARAGVKFLETMHAGMQEKIQAIEARLEKNPQDEEAQKELQTVYMTSQQRMQTEQQNVVTLLYDAIQRVMNTYREQNGYELILNAEVAAAFSPALDVTTAVIAEVNKQKIEFKPLTGETATPEEKKNSGDDAAASDRNGEAKKQ
ncbi:MAG: OmpH family outer membrane protein [Desulfovibrio sp.]|jgi:outer membrane protein|nr:OmpH family outer membrane protein [Desulfovibrio sp.]